MTGKFACPCCGYLTLPYKPPGTFEICPVCYWEDDNLQYAAPDRRGGANSICLREAKENFRRYGAISIEFLDAVRLPLQEELP